MRKYSESKKWQTVPENTGLEMIHDNRSGEKLEIVLLVFNEEKRIGNILNYYREFDIVLLDGGSNDRTIEMAIQGGASIFNRIGESLGENHYVFYVNKITKSGYCFNMMTDEFIDKNDLEEASRHLQSSNAVIAVRKIEWIYGEEPKTKPSTVGMARGMQRGSAAYDSYHLHNSLQYINNTEEPKKVFIYDLHHLHIKSTKNEYGKYGRYADIEVRQFLMKEATSYQYFRRYVVPIIVFALWRVWFNKTTFRCKIFRIMELVMAMQLAVMCWIEQKFMPTVEKQMTIYASKYLEETNEMAKVSDALSITSGKL